MKSLEQTLTKHLVSLRHSSAHSDNPIIEDLLYCSVRFLSEATKAVCGGCPQPSSQLAKRLAAQRRKRLRFYRRMAKLDVPAKLTVISRNHV